MSFLRKTKTWKFSYICCFTSVIAFIGLLIVALILFNANSNGYSPAYLGFLKVLIALFTVIFIISCIYLFFKSKYYDNALLELTEAISQAEGEVAASLALKNDSEIDIKTISTVLTHSLESLNEKNQKLMWEIERNERLSENISEFYRQMRTLRDADFKFDFFEYDISNSIFFFISGMVTAIDNNVEISEITGEDLFKDYGFSIGYEDFLNRVERCLAEDTTLDFECSIRRSDGNTYWLKVWGSPSKDKTRITGAISDITRIVNERDAEKERAIHDAITGFYNRNALNEVAGKAIAQKKEDEYLAFIYVGLKGFKEFQDRFGMVAGSNYIRVGAEVFKKFMFEKLIPFRWWGSDFLVIATGLHDLSHIKRDIPQITEKIEACSVDVDGIAVTFSLAVGYAVYGIHGKTPSELLEYASFAEHEAIKGVAPSPNEFNGLRYEQSRNASLRRTFIKDIIDRNQLSVVFQPIISLRTGELFGFEALSRPSNPIYENIVDLIEDAESSGYYSILEKRMIYNALEAFKSQNDNYRDQYLFINTAPFATLDEDDYYDIRDRYFNHMKVVFEVVERNQLDPEEINIRKSIVTKAGAKFALDDFGTGYSNHLALLALEPDIIKIDRELVKDIDHDLRKQHMLEDIISYARYRGTRVLAEGVETQDELETLCRMGIDYAQGYFTGKPNPDLMPPIEKAQEVIRSIRRNNQMSMEQVHIIIQRSLALFDKALAENTFISAYLVMVLGTRLGYSEGRLEALVITTVMHDIGVLFPGCEKWRPSECEEIPEHSIFTYLLLKEFFPYPDFIKAVLYHHTHYGSENNILGNIPVPDEAYLLALTNAAAEIIIANRNSGQLHDILMQELYSDKYKPEYVKDFCALCDEDFLEHIVSGEYQKALADYMRSLKVGKAEVEGILRTFIYAVTFRAPFGYSHARTMETMAGILARLTKQNWNLLERVRIAALLYNLGMLTIDNETLQTKHSPEHLHQLLSSGLKEVSSILREADLVDLVDMFNGIIGERTASDKRMLMEKDILNGSNMLNIADIFSALVEEKNTHPDMFGQDILTALKQIAEKENLYLPMINMMEDFIEDIEARVSHNQQDIAKHYQNIISRYKRLKARSSIMVD